MKKFFIKLAAAVGCLGLVLVPISSFSKYSTQKFLLDKSKLKNSATILAIGDSHIECSLDPDLFPEMENRGLSAEWLFYSLPKLEYYLNNNAQIKTVILAYSTHSLLKGLESTILGDKSPTFYNKYMPLIVESEVSKDLYLDYAVNKLSIPFYIQSEWGLPSKQLINNITNNSDLYRGGFLRGNKILTEGEAENTNLGEVDDQEFSPLLEVSLQKIVRLVRDRGLNLVLYNSPCHKNHRHKNVTNILNKMDSIADELCKDEQIHYINYFDYPLQDSMFRDYDHINIEGAKIITPMLRDTLIKLGYVNC